VKLMNAGAGPAETGSCATRAVAGQLARRSKAAKTVPSPAAPRKHCAWQYSLAEIELDPEESLWLQECRWPRLQHAIVHSVSPE